MPRSDHRPDRASVIDGPMDGDSFLACIEQMLVPTLHAGDIVVADNLPTHGTTASVS